VSSWPQRGRLVLRLRYRTDALDAGAAARIAGYHLTALEQIAADPGAEHGQQSLLSPDEVRFQLEGLAGPDRDRPWDRRVHELFEQRVRAHPDAIAAVHGGRRWSYAELNARANRLARALLARGLGREGVVAVVTERNLDWMAAVLAIFKAGGVYLPIEPHFPADRIARTLTRAGCELVLTEPGSTGTLGPALRGMPGAELLFVETSASRSGRISSPTSTSPAAPPASPRARCASTRACSTTCTPRSRTWRSARGRWSRRPHRNASTSPCGSWFPRCWSAAGR
jgi:non-ribosomal peptide synthetase component F